MRVREITVLSLALVVVILVPKRGFAQADEDHVITLDGRFGSFATLGEPGERVRALGPDRIEKNEPDEYRKGSTWVYFLERGIRVRICDDHDRVGAVNAIVAPSTRRYATEAGVRIGDPLAEVREAYGDRLRPVLEVDAPVHVVEDESNGHLLTFGFDDEGAMTWIALGDPRANGYTCGHPES